MPGRRTVVSLECRGQIDMPEIGNGTFGVCGPVLLNIVSFDGQRSLAEFGRTIDAASFTGQQFQKNRIFFPARIQVLDDIFDITQIGESHFYNLFAFTVDTRKHASFDRVQRTDSGLPGDKVILCSRS